MSLFKDTNFDKDEIVRPYDVSVPGSDIGNVAWSPYPRHNGERRALLDVFFHEQLNLAEISNDINRFMSIDGNGLLDLSADRAACDHDLGGRRAAVEPGLSLGRHRGDDPGNPGL